MTEGGREAIAGVLRDGGVALGVTVVRTPAPFATRVDAEVVTDCKGEEREGTDETLGVRLGDRVVLAGLVIENDLIAVR